MGAIMKLIYRAVGNNMKKFSVLVCSILLIPAAALAQERTFYDIGQDIFTLVEKYTACTAGDIACTEEDVRALQAEAESNLHELEILLRSGNYQHMHISPAQVHVLSERLDSVKEQLLHIELFDTLCNKAIINLQRAIISVGGVLWLMAYFLGSGGCLGCYAIVLLLIPALIITLSYVLISLILMAPCLFWWL
jgi:hypothetical protein